MKAPTTKTLTIRALRRPLLQLRQFAVPKLQRSFVWDARRAAKLLDSIYFQMPIGSLFLWEMDRQRANLIRQALGVLPSFNAKNKKIWFVIDGQQRLSVIYQAFKAESRENDAGQSIDFGRLCFVVRPDPEAEDAPRIVYRKPVDTEFVPLHDILEVDWKRRMPSQAKWFLARIQDCRDRFLDYPVPIVTVTSATKEEIGEVFIRVNSQGMRITSADRAIALMGALDLRTMADEQDKTELTVFRQRWDRYQKAFVSAVDYLRNCFPVYDESYLPSENMLATLSVFFFHHAGQPNAHQRQEIRKWFWATGLAKRYSGAGYHRNIVADAVLFEALAGGKRKYFTMQDLLDPTMDLQGEEYNSGSACARTFFCLLASHAPRFLENGEPIFLNSSPVSHANRKHRHHVFPQAQLKGHFAARAYNSLCNICFLVSRENQSIGYRVPRSYLGEYFGEGRARFRKVMRSHLIPADDESGIWERSITKGFPKFRQQRLALLCAAFEKAAGMKLFRKV